MDVRVHEQHTNSLTAHAARLLTRHNATITRDNSVKPLQCSWDTQRPYWATRPCMHI
jgi:hypothetical protein